MCRAFFLVSNSRDLVSVRQLSSLSARSNPITRGYQVLWMGCADDGLPDVDAAPNSPRWTRDQRREAKAGRCCPAPGAECRSLPFKQAGHASLHARLLLACFWQSE